jgi:hypothetical protein
MTSRLYLYGTFIAYLISTMKRTTIKTTGEGRNQMEGILYITEIARKKVIVCSMVILIVFLWATASFGSWSTGFGKNGLYGGVTYNIIKIEVFDLGGTSGFEAPGMYDFTAGSWTVQLPNTKYVLATNATPGISNFNWFFSFTGNSSDSLHLAYLAYTSTGQVFGSYIDYNYGGTPNWSIPTIEGLDVNDPIYDRTASSVPLPPAVFLFSGGLLSLVALRKKITT